MIPALSFFLNIPLMSCSTIMNIELGLITTRDIAYRAVEGLVSDGLLSVGVGLGDSVLGSRSSEMP